MGIAAQVCPKNPDAAAMLDRMLQLLASYSVLTCSVAEADASISSQRRVYGLAPVAKYFMQNRTYGAGRGVSLGPLLALLQDKVFIDSWSVFSLPLLFASKSITLSFYFVSHGLLGNIGQDFCSLLSIT